MSETTQNERVQAAAELAAAARDRGMEQLEGAKGQLAEGAERVASAVERTADELDGDGDGTLSGFGHSVASLMRRLAGGLRERDVEEFAHELGALARRNPGVFLAGSVALGFGVARFFKARAPQSVRGDYRQQSSGAWQSAAPNLGRRADFDGDDSLDLSASPTPGMGRSAEHEGHSASDARAAEANQGEQTEAAPNEGDAVQQSSPTDDERGQSKSRSPGKQSKRGGKP
jgi:hypothetical protein